MVERTILERALSLDPVQRLELIVALQDSIDDSAVTPEMAQFIRGRATEAAANPGDTLSLDALEQRLRARQSA